MKKERVRTKRGFRGFGKFVLGWFVGFISTILLIVGLGYWAYTSLSVRKIEKFTKSDITDNDSLEKLTLKKAVAIVQGITKSGTDSYTLAKLEEDFNIELPKTLGDTGISLDIIKNSSFKNFEQAIEDTVQTITFNNILNFIGTEESDDLGIIDTILEKETIYYIYNGKLYTNIEHTIEVDFDYTIQGTVVKLDTGAQNTIASNQVKFTLSDLPLNNALQQMTPTTKDLQIYQLLDYHYDSVSDRYYQEYRNGMYSIPVSGVMGAIADYTIDELSDQSKIDALKIHEVMGYYKNEVDGNYYTSETFSESSRVSSIMNTLADKVIGDLSNEETFNSLYIYDIMGYYHNLNDGYYYTKPDFSANSKVNGIMATLAGKTINQLDDDGAFNDILIADALGYTIKGNQVFESDGTTEVKGVVKQLVLNGSKISTIASDVKTLTIDKILDIDPSDSNTSSVIRVLCNKGTTIDTLNKNINDLKLGEILGVEEGDPNNSPVVNALWSKTIKELNGAIYNLTLGQALGKTYDEATGVIKTFYNTRVVDLADEISDIKIWQAMGYFEKVEGEGDGAIYSYYLNYNDDTKVYSNPVTGIMATLAGKSVSDLSDSETFDNLKVYEIMGYTKNGSGYTDRGGQPVKGIMSLLADTTMVNIPTKVEDIVNTTKINELINSGVIVVNFSLDSDTATFFSNYTIPQLIKFINDNIDTLKMLQLG